MEALSVWLSEPTSSTSSVDLHVLVMAAVDESGGGEATFHRVVGAILHQCDRDTHIDPLKRAAVMTHLQRIYDERMEQSPYTINKDSQRTAIEPSTTTTAVSNLKPRVKPLRSAISLEEKKTPPHPAITSQPTRVLRRALTEDPNRSSVMPFADPLAMVRSFGRDIKDRRPLARSLLKSMPSYLQTSVEETYFCFICFENVAVVDAYTLDACSHRYCQQCLSQYVTCKITDGDVYPTCFHEIEDSARSGTRQACGFRIDASDIKAVVSADVWAKYERFKFTKEVEYARQCPHCGHMQKCAGPSRPACVCESCRRPFCYVHSNAHNGATCADFELTHMEEEKINRAAIALFAKPCPGCGNNVEKNGGCNHMTCIACATSFCWICNEIIENAAVPDHFAWWNLSGCAGQQMIDVDHQTRGERIGWLVCRAIHLVICVPIAIAVAIVLSVATGGCVACIFWLHEDPRRIFLGLVDKVATFLQFVIVLLILGPVSLVVMLCRWLGGCARRSLSETTDEYHANV